MSNGTSSCPTITLPFGVFAATPTIAPLDPADFPPADPPPNLEQFIMDNAPTDATALDGFDQVFLETVGIVDALDRALGGLAGDLLDAFAEADLIDPAPVGDTVAGYTASLDVSSSSVDDLGKLLGTAAPPTPTGGGGGGAAGAQCQGELDFYYLAAVPVTTRVGFGNPTAVEFHVKAISFTQDTPGVFTETNNIPTVLVPGAAYFVDVTYAVHAPVGTRARLVVESDAPNSPNVLCVVLTATAPSPPLPGGGGGGGKHP